MSAVIDFVVIGPVFIFDSSKKNYRKNQILLSLYFSHFFVNRTGSEHLSHSVRIIYSGSGLLAYFFVDSKSHIPTYCLILISCYFICQVRRQKFKPWIPDSVWEDSANQQECGKKPDPLASCSLLTLFQTSAYGAVLQSHNKAFLTNASEYAVQDHSSVRTFGNALASNIQMETKVGFVSHLRVLCVSPLLLIMGSQRKFHWTVTFSRVLAQS